MERTNLIEFLENNEIISIYTNEDQTNKFIAGYLLEVDDSYFLLASITPQGVYDGYILKTLDSIVYIHSKGKYEEKIDRLLNHNSKSYKMEIWKNKENNYILPEFLGFIKENDYVCSIEICSSGYNDVIGYIDFFDDQICSIRVITEYGEDDGISVIQLKDITLIASDSDEEQTIKLLQKDCQRI